jgi:hypothetical protein
MLGDIYKSVPADDWPGREVQLADTILGNTPFRGTEAMHEPIFPAQQRYSVCRSPAWRWQRARAIVERGLTCTARTDDAATRRVVDYLRACEWPLGSSQAPGGVFADAVLHAAHRLYEAEGLVRFIVQARLLARQSPHDVARLTSFEPDTIECFESIFFEVREHLDAPDWLANQVLWPGLEANLPTEALGGALMAIGYWLGPAILDIALAVATGATLPSWIYAPAGEPKRLYEARVRLSAKLLLAVLTLRTSADAVAMQKLRRAKTRLERQIAGIPVPADPILDAMLDWMASMSRRRPEGPAQKRPTASLPAPRSRQAPRRVKVQRPQTANFRSLPPPPRRKSHVAQGPEADRQQAPSR